MNSPENYYMQLKGKSIAEIQTAIRGLKMEIGRLKKVLETPFFDEERLGLHPTPSNQLYYHKLYLKKAKEALVEAGGVYTLSRMELKIQRFEESVPYISKIIFVIGGFFQGSTMTTITIQTTQIKIKKEHLQSRDGILADLVIKKDFLEAKETFVETMKELSVGEWNRHYIADGVHHSHILHPRHLEWNRHYIEDGVCDGTQWELKVYFSNDHRVAKIDGSNAYPYNFNEFKELLDDLIRRYDDSIRKEI